MENGEDYRGYKSVAEDGSTCLNWTITTSYRFYRNPMDYPDAGLGDHNYCRNPGGTGWSSPWCYYSASSSGVSSAPCNVGSSTLECTHGSLLDSFYTVYYVFHNDINISF